MPRKSARGTVVREVLYIHVMSNCTYDQKKKMDQRFPMDTSDSRDRVVCFFFVEFRCGFFLVLARHDSDDALPKVLVVIIKAHCSNLVSSDDSQCNNLEASRCLLRK
jgi:hypothetical protein